MNKLLQVAADKELNRAILAGEEASTKYYGIIRRFVSGIPVFPGAKRRLPQTRLDAVGLKEIDTAWDKLDNANKTLRNAYMKLYAAYL
jgi:hypothetical protein